MEKRLLDTKQTQFSFPMILSSVKQKKEENSNKSLFKNDENSSDEEVNVATNEVPHISPSQSIDHLKRFVKKAEQLNTNSIRKLQEEKNISNLPKRDRSFASFYKNYSLENQNQQLTSKQKEIRKIYLKGKTTRPKKLYQSIKKNKVIQSNTIEVQTDERIPPVFQTFHNPNMETFETRQQNQFNFNLHTIDSENKIGFDEYRPRKKSLKQIKNIYEEEEYEEALPKRTKPNTFRGTSRFSSINDKSFKFSKTNDATTFMDTISKTSQNFTNQMNKLQRYRQYNGQQTVYGKKSDAQSLNLPIYKDNFPKIYVVENNKNELKNQMTNKSFKTLYPIVNAERSTKKKTISALDGMKKNPIISQKTENYQKTSQFSFLQRKATKNSVGVQYQSIGDLKSPIKKANCVDFEIQVPSYHQIKVYDEFKNQGNDMTTSKFHPIKYNVTQKQLQWITQKYHPKENLLQNLNTDHFQIKKYKNGVYFGELNEQLQKSGKGAIFYYNGRLYEGQFNNDFKEGKGQQHFPDGSKYRGQYRKGMREGKGIFEWNNGQVYDGQWVKGRKNGSGMWQGIEGESYLGEWKNGKVQGFGVFIMKDGSRYEGQFYNSLKHGLGTERFENGDTYVGTYEKNRPNGEGQLYWNNGNYYKGTFSNGLRHGQGIFKEYKSKIQYTGDYRNDKKCGYGELVYPDNKQYYGNFENNYRHGYGQLFEEGALTFKGYWINDASVEEIAEEGDIIQEVGMEREESLPNVIAKGKLKINSIGKDLKSKNNNKPKQKNSSIEKQSRRKSLSVDKDGFKRHCGCNKKH